MSSWQIDIKDDQAGTRRRVVAVCLIKKSDSLLSVFDEVEICVKLGGFDGRLDEKHVRRVVFDNQDVAPLARPFRRGV